MNRKEKTLGLIIEQGILPIYFHPDAAVSIEILRTLYKAGYRVVEYLNREKNAIDNFLELRKVADKELPGLQLGAGTIRNKIEATEFINEGANFIVCPGVMEAIGDIAHTNDILWVPGCLTATEIMMADDLGAGLIKLFPGIFFGPAYLASMKQLFPDLLFMPTGGVETSEENLSSWFKSGASAAGLMSKLIPENLVKLKDYSGIESLARQTLQVAKQIKINIKSE